MAMQAVGLVKLPNRSDLADEVRGDAGAGCPMSGLLETLTRPWTFHIIWQLTTHGPMRFGALRRAIAGISPRLLTVRLRALEAEGFVRRTVMGGKVPEVSYAPTSRLAEMEQVMANLHELSVKWRAEDVARG